MWNIVVVPNLLAGQPPGRSSKMFERTAYVEQRKRSGGPPGHHEACKVRDVEFVCNVHRDIDGEADECKYAGKDDGGEPPTGVVGCKCQDKQHHRACDIGSLPGTVSSAGFPPSSAVRSLGHEPGAACQISEEQSNRRSPTSHCSSSRRPDENFAHKSVHTTV